MTYGGTVPTITPGYAGFVNGDTGVADHPAHLLDDGDQREPGAARRTRPRAAARPTRTTRSLRGRLDDRHQAPLTITASNGTMTYGGTVPTITPGYAGFVNGDTSRRSPPSPPARPRPPARARSSGSPYTSSCSGAVDANYAISYVAGSVTVTQAPLTITASSRDHDLRATVPTITPGYAGFVNGDTAASLTTAADLLDHRRLSSTVAGFAVCVHRVAVQPTPTTPSPTCPGSVTVNQAPLTVTASSGRP